MPSENTALKPVPKLENDFYNWYQRHDSKVREAQSCNHEIVFIGDSITHLFEGDLASPGRGEKIWKELFAAGKAMNLGFGWDRTQNVLWRLDNGEFANQTPKMAVVLIGTNNLTGTENARTNSPAEIVGGIQAVCGRILSLSPQTHILLMGIFPRSSPSDPLRKNIREINSNLEKWASGRKGFQFLDIGDKFLSPDKFIPKELMDDGVHPTTEGYRIWAEAIGSNKCGSSKVRKCGSSKV